MERGQKNNSPRLCAAVALLFVKVFGIKHPAGCRRNRPTCRRLAPFAWPIAQTADHEPFGTLCVADCTNGRPRTVWHPLRGRLHKRLTTNRLAPFAWPIAQTADHERLKHVNVHDVLLHAAFYRVVKRSAKAYPAHQGLKGHVSRNQALYVL